MKHRVVAFVVLSLACVTLAADKPSTAPAAAEKGAPGKHSLTKTWIGEELWKFGGEKHEGDPKKSWRLIPGSKIELQYSGTGPLPKPVEFVIPLDNEPLPLGRVYYLSVKNWYVGKMEAQLGDITQTLTTPRYDWTPIARFEPNERVDKIVLRYFPSVIVADSGKPHTQPYIVQGVFLSTEPTNVPFQGGEVISLLAQAPPVPRKGNYFDNGSFESGLYPWGPAIGVSRSKVIDQANLDETTAAHGKSSIKLTPDAGSMFGLNNKMYALSPGKYTFSFYAKADKPVQVLSRIRGLHTSLKDYADTAISDKVELTTEWKRYSITNEIKDQPGYLYTAEFRAPVKEAINVWFDAIQLENGDLTEYQPRNPLEIGYVSNKPGNIYYAGEGSAVVDVLLNNTGNPSQATVNYKVEDYWGKQVDQGSKAVDVKAEGTRVSMPLFDKQSGIFRVLFTAGDAQAEMVYSVVPPNPHLTSKYPEGTLGTDGQLHDPKALAILKRANFNWVLEKNMTRWVNVEREQDKYVFVDQFIKNGDDAHMNVMLQLFNMNSYYRNQPWMEPYVIPTIGDKSERDPGIWKADKQEEFLKHWSEFVFKTVDHYKGSVKYWEIFNEPNHELGGNAAGGEQYGHALKASAEQIRKADPQAKIVAFSGGGFNRDFYDAAVKVAGPESFDIASVHFYGNFEENFKAYGEMLDTYKKPGWNTETGPTCNTFFITLPTFSAFQQDEFRKREHQERHTQTQHSVKNYLLSLSLGKMDKWFHYFSRFTNSGPSQPTRWAGNGKEITEYDGSLRANGAGLTIASHFIDGAKYHGPVKLGGQLDGYVFDKAGKSVGFFWAGAGQTMTLAAAGGMTFYDVMGNPIADKSIQVTESPVYFTSDTNAQAASQALGAVKVVAVAGAPSTGGAVSEATQAGGKKSAKKESPSATEAEGKSANRKAKR